jgi:hypothetical protein
MVLDRLEVYAEGSDRQRIACRTRYKSKHRHNGPPRASDRTHKSGQLVIVKATTNKRHCDQIV